MSIAIGRVFLFTVAATLASIGSPEARLVRVACDTNQYGACLAQCNTTHPAYRSRNGTESIGRPEELTNWNECATSCRRDAGCRRVAAKAPSAANTTPPAATQPEPIPNELRGAVEPSTTGSVPTRALEQSESVAQPALTGAANAENYPKPPNNIGSLSSPNGTCSVLTATGLPMTGPCSLFGRNAPPTLQYTTVEASQQASSPPVAPWLDALETALTGSSAEGGNTVSGCPISDCSGRQSAPSSTISSSPLPRNFPSPTSQTQQAHSSSAAALQTSSTSLNGTMLSFQEMQDRIKACSGGACNCPIYPVNEKSYCGGKGSICGEEPSQKYSDSYDPRDQYKFSQCFGDCFSKATSYNSLAQKCGTHTGSE
jgi:hypothetical protein